MLAAAILNADAEAWAFEEHARRLSRALWVEVSERPSGDGGAGDGLTVASRRSWRMAAFDRSSKWLIDHFGDSFLRLGGVEGVRSWRAIQPEVVQPAQLPDGLIEARLAGRRKPCSCVVEIATYPERRLIRQLVRDALLVYLNREVVPETLAVVLRPRGRLEIPEVVTLPSEEGWTDLRLRWRVVELWKV